MTISYLGSLSVGGAVPGAALAVSAGIAGVSAALGNLAAQLAALNAFVPAAIDFGAQLSLAEQMVTSVSAAISLGLSPPSLDAQIAIIQAQVAALTLILETIQANLDILVSLEAPLTAAGVHGYAFAGAVSALGSELGAALAAGVPGGSPSDHGNAIISLTTIPETWDAMSIIFKVAP